LSWSYNQTAGGMTSSSGLHNLSLKINRFAIQE